jgi:hypothetical protein
MIRGRMSEWMIEWKKRHVARATAVLGAGLLLLAAGEAPELTLTPTATVPAASEMPEAVPEAVMVPAIVEEAHEPVTVAEPELGPVLPEADSLAALVEGVRAMDGLVLDRQLLCLATAVYFESKGEPLTGQLAVAQVILNRVERGRFGADICAVVKAPRQFSFVRGGRMPEPTNTRQWATARAIAVIAASEAHRPVVGEATHFHATRVNPGWRLQRVASIGNHIFYR